MKVKDLIGRRIKYLRQMRGKTQEELAETMEISPKYLSSIERGKENPTLDTFINLANALGVEIDEIFTISDEGINSYKLRAAINHLLKESDEKKLQQVVKILRVILH